METPYGINTIIPYIRLDVLEKTNSPIAIPSIDAIVLIPNLRISRRDASITVPMGIPVPRADTNIPRVLGPPPNTSDA